MAARAMGNLFEPRRAYPSGAELLPRLHLAGPAVANEFSTFMGNYVGKPER
jgi:hypothetical protein